MEQKPHTLTDIVLQVAEITSALVESGGELSPELESQLLEIDLSLSRKIDAYSTVIERLEMEGDFWDAKAKKMKAIADSHKRMRDAVRTRIKDAMRAMDKNEICGDDVKFKLVRSQPRLVIRDEKLIPSEFHVVKMELDRERIKRELAQDVRVPGAELEESYALRTFVKRD